LATRQGLSLSTEPLGFYLIVDPFVAIILVLAGGGARFHVRLAFKAVISACITSFQTAD